jgi:hypothetical protein
LPDDPIKRWENEGGALASPPLAGSQESSLAEIRDEPEKFVADDNDARSSSTEATPVRREVHA